MRSTLVSPPPHLITPLRHHESVASTSVPSPTLSASSASGTPVRTEPSASFKSYARPPAYRSQI